MEILSVKDLTFAYPDSGKNALDGVSFSVTPGEFVVVCGPSGCGKTTLLRLLKREIAPHGDLRGVIRYSGALMAELSDRRSASEIGMVIQNPEHQVVTDKVWHELAFGLESLGTPSGEIRRKLAEISGFFGISGWFHERTSLLSGGQKQVLSLASVMVMQPKLLLLDEPTSQLDPIAASGFLHTLGKLNRDLGLTIILAEHRLEEVFPMADRVMVMDEGRILFYDTASKIGELVTTRVEGRRMLEAMPSSVRIFAGLGMEGPSPLTVKDGRAFLAQYVSEKSVSCEFSGGEPDRPSDEPNGSSIAVRLKEAWFRYEADAPDILQGVTLKARQGEIFSILGENGCGKTTLMKVISGQVRTYRGSVEIFGKKIKGYKGIELYRNCVAYLPQDPETVFLKSTVLEDLSEAPRAMGLEKSQIDAAVKRIAEILEIGPVLDKHPYDLSGGEQQRSALAKVLLLQPKILLLDEPTKGIDTYAKRMLRGILRDLAREGMTILIVTHDVEFAAIASDRCAMLFSGEIVGEDCPGRFFSTNEFYTTAASRISRVAFEGAVTVEEVLARCDVAALDS